MTKLKKKHKKKIIFLVLLTFLIVLGFSISHCSFASEFSTNNSSTSHKEDPIKVYTASLIATGDGLIHSPLYKAAKKDDNTYDFSNMLTLVKDKIKDYDLKYYNQETVFDDSKSYSSYPIFNTPSAFGQNMIDTGFNLVSLATNHSMDAGSTSAKNSASFWEKQENVLAVGMSSTEEMRNNYQIKEINGITYTMLSYTYGTNGIPVPSNEKYIVNVYNEEEVLQDIASVREKVDILIVAMHWGTEYYQDATETQKKEAQFLADNGVDIILGNHSHCIEPWEMIGDTVVFYSFGNFISNQMGANEQKVRRVGSIGMFGTLSITKTVDTENNTTEIKIDNVGADLTYTYRYYDSAISKNNYLVIPFSMMSSNYLGDKYDGVLKSIKTIYGKSYTEVYEEYSNVLTKLNDTINIEKLPLTN